MFITLEGIDGSGKSTQAKLLAEALGEDTLLLREPGGTEAAERIREILADPAIELDPRAELLLFCAARADLVIRQIEPALAAGRSVVCDRFTDSTVAYQGVARGLGVDLVERLNEATTGGLKPDLTLLLRIDPEIAAQRLSGEADRFEDEGLEFQRTVAGAYDEIAAAEPERVLALDGTQEVAALHAAILDLIRQSSSPGLGNAPIPG
ncbi:MAG: dTMP kinase [Solirubrobacterales bacterium]|nr:dTMP kinase [Solirubrobacterales bacterium]